LILNLDLEDQDSSYLISLCLEHELIKGLIYVCTKESTDEFMAPLSKLWGLYQHCVISEDGDIEKGRRYGLRGLWYVRMCLRRETIEGN
jgi:hypothetical protein